MEQEKSSHDDRLRMDNVLLANLRREAPRLRALLEKMNGHWVQEDGMYRFYYQSFKVFYLQYETAEMVALLTQP